MADSVVHNLLITLVHLCQSIKNYVSGVCMINELNGFPKVTRGALYRNVIRGIRPELKKQIKQAEPLTRELLHKMLNHVNMQDQQELAVWVAILFGYNLFLRKSDLVPDCKQHEPEFQLSRQDI